MAIDFSQVKRLQITDSSNNTVEVIKIQNASNVVLWQRKVVTSITLSGQNTSLNKDSTFIFGGTVTAHYNDNTTANVTTSTTFSGYDMSTAGSQTVTATYTEEGVTVTATYTLTVVAESWTTLWTGNVEYTNGSGNVCQLSSLTGTKTLRFTFTMSVSGQASGSTTVYYDNHGNTTTSTKPSSPFTTTINTSNYTTKILGIKCSSGTKISAMELLWTAGSTKYFQIQSSNGSGGTNGNAKLKITKIEMLQS